MGSPQQIMTATVHCPEEAPLLEQIEGLRKPIAEAVRQAKWSGGKVQINATVIIGVLFFLEKAVKSINDLTQRVEAMEAPAEEEEPLVPVD